MKKKISVKASKPSILMLHRYPPEFELDPFPGFLDFVKELSKNYNISYFGISWNRELNQELRSIINVEELPIKVDITNFFDKWFKTLLFYFYLPVLFFKIKKSKPFVIICRENFPFLTSIISLTRIPILVELSDWWPSLVLGNTEKGKKIANFIETKDVRFWRNKSILVLAHNRSEMEYVKRMGIDSNKIKIIHFPMYGGFFRPVDSYKYRKKLGISKSDFLVVTRGIIHKTKGIDQILEWWKEIIKLHPDWKMLILAGSVSGKEFYDKIEKLGIRDSLIIQGWIKDKELLNKYFNMADCLLVTRRNSPDTEGNTPSSLAHFLMTSRPVLATGLQGICEIITDKKNGFLYIPDNYESFKNSLEYIWKHKKESKKIGKNGAILAKNYFDARKIANDYDVFIKDTINMSKSTF